MCADSANTEHPEPALSGVVHRNITALLEMRQRELRHTSIANRVADAVTAFAGSMWCVYVHALGFGFWITANLGWIPRVRPWDPFPFVMLAAVTSVEAIFLSTFILITQNRMQGMAERRAELDLQISLLTEHELTQAVRLIDAVAEQLKVPRPSEEELRAVKQDVHPEQVADEIEQAERRKPR